MVRIKTEPTAKQATPTRLVEIHMGHKFENFNFDSSLSMQILGAKVQVLFPKYMY